VDWLFLEGRFGEEVYTDNPGHPPLPTRLMAGLAILKHTYDLSDEVLCERWVENPYYQSGFPVSVRRVGMYPGDGRDGGFLPCAADELLEKDNPSSARHNVQRDIRSCEETGFVRRLIEFTKLLAARLRSDGVRSRKTNLAAR
jgi:Transposase domain (DUF772)